MFRIGQGHKNDKKLLIVYSLGAAMERVRSFAGARLSGIEINLTRNMKLV